MVITARYLLAPEAAEIARTTVPALYQLRHRGDGPPCVKYGKKLLYREDELIAWLESHKTAAGV